MDDGQNYGLEGTATADAWDCWCLVWRVGHGMDLLWWLRR